MKRSHRVLAGLGIVLWSSVALAWHTDVPFRMKIHGHLFDRVVLENDDACKVRVTLYFTAPAAAYSNAQEKKNHYRFQARLKFSAGRVWTTNVFSNDAAGRRVYRTRIDTSSEGCWGKSDPKLYNVDVEGCRGRRCIPEGSY